MEHQPGQQAELLRNSRSSIGLKSFSIQEQTQRTVRLHKMNPLGQTSDQPGVAERDVI